MDIILIKLESLDSKLDDVKVQQAVNNEQLAEHMRRTDLLERRVDQEAMSTKPIKNAYERSLGVLKFIAILGTIVAILKGTGIL